MEENETFSIAMRFDSMNVVPTISAIEVTIIDNDSKLDWVISCLSYMVDFGSVFHKFKIYHAL